MQNRARSNPKRVTLGNAEEYNVLKAAQILYEEGIAQPILLGEKKYIKEQMKKFGIETPIIQAVNQVLFENKNPKQAVDELMQRMKKDELAPDLWER